MTPVNYNQLRWQERKRIREQYVQEQEGLCHFCGHSLGGVPAPEVQDARVNLSLFPPGFMKHPVHLHHSHQTGMTIGAVHARCNAVLWQYCGE